jgi:hypothetical protein
MAKTEYESSCTWYTFDEVQFIIAATAVPHSELLQGQGRERTASLSIDTGRTSTCLSFLFVFFFCPNPHD